MAGDSRGRTGLRYAVVFAVGVFVGVELGYGMKHTEERTIRLQVDGS